MKLSVAFTAGIAVATFVVVLIFWRLPHSSDDRPQLLDISALQNVASPGELSSVHAFMEHDCAACHTPIKGPDASNCKSCHANNSVLTIAQTTSFHATLSECRGCHVEHRGGYRVSTTMEHQVFSRIAQKGLPDIVRLAHPPRVNLSTGISPDEAILDCAVCHTNQDPHRMLFGSDCTSCHGTSTWTIQEFQHPSMQSTDCAQCHQAPPSHYMMHFQMVSMSVAGIEHADVEQCFLCHQTNAWNDIKGVGWYKHH